jgi:hypothetical protein
MPYHWALSHFAQSAKNIADPKRRAGKRSADLSFRSAAFCCQLGKNC